MKPLLIIHQGVEIGRAENPNEVAAQLLEIGLTRDQIRIEVCPEYMKQVYEEVCQEYFQVG